MATGKSQLLLITKGPILYFLPTYTSQVGGTHDYARRCRGTDASATRERNHLGGGWAWVDSAALGLLARKRCCDAYSTSGDTSRKSRCVYTSLCTGSVTLFLQVCGVCPGAQGISLSLLLSVHATSEGMQFQCTPSVSSCLSNT